MENGCPNPKTASKLPPKCQFVELGRSTKASVIIHVNERWQQLVDSISDLSPRRLLDFLNCVIHNLIQLGNRLGILLVMSLSRVSERGEFILELRQLCECVLTSAVGPNILKQTR